MFVALLASCSTPSSNIHVFTEAEQNKASMRLGLALQYLRSGHLQSAWQQLKLAYQANPNDGAVHEAKGLFFAVQGDEDAARNSFLQALKLSPNQPAVRNNYAAFLYRYGYYAEALKQLQLLEKTAYYRHHPQLHLNLARSALRSDQYRLAAQAFAKATETQSKQVTAWLGWAEACYEYRDMACVYKQLKRYFQEGGKEPKAYEIGLASAREQGDWQSIVHYLRQLHGSPK